MSGSDEKGATDAPPDLTRVRYEERPPAVWLTIDNPPVNVLTMEVITELDRALEAAAARPELPLVVLRGAPGQGFSAGVDIAAHAPDEVERMLEEFHRLIRTAWSIDQITLAVVDGAALGGGCELVLACDLVLASEEASFGQPEIDVGCFPPVAAALLPRRIGHPLACEMMYLGRPVSAARAAEMGLVNWVVPAAELESRYAEIAGLLQEKSAAVLRTTRRAIHAAREADWRAALQRTEAIYLRQLTRTEDMAEGVRAFMEGREPRWKGE